MEQYSKELHRPVYKPKAFRQVISNGKDDIWAIDLTDMGTDWVDDNEEYRYIFFCIDVFTRYAWAIPLKSKEAKSTLDALDSILKQSGRKPNRLWHDQGGEFLSRIWTGHLKKLGITQYSTYGTHKASTVERLQRSIKNWMWRKFDEKQTRKWVGLMPELMSFYNHKTHSTLKMSPLSASELDKEGQEALFTYQYGDTLDAPLGKPKYHLGQWVRISRIKGQFEKGFHPNWSYEIFQIKSIGLDSPVLYYLEDFKKEPISGGFYEAELNPVADPGFFPIEKVIKKRTVKGQKQVYVKWLGYKEPSWILESDITDSFTDP